VSDALKDALALLPSIVCASVAFSLSFVVSGALWFNVSMTVAVFAACMWFLLRNSQWRMGATVISSLVVLAVLIGPSVIDRMASRPAPVSQELVQHLAAAAIPLDDLEPLRKVWRGTRVIALGKPDRRITEFLITQMGFRNFAMEVAFDDATATDVYIQGTAAKTVPSDEIVEWMRTYNASVPKVDRVHFHGIDYQGDRRDFRMARNVLALIETLGPEGRLILWSRNAQVSSAPGRMGSYLRSTLRDQLYLTGYEFDSGKIGRYDVAPADTRYYAAALRQTGKPALFLDFRTLMLQPALEAWIERAQFTHEVQEFYGPVRLLPTWTRTEDSWSSLFDGVIYHEKN